METNYNGHLIRSLGDEKPGTDKWIAKVVVMWPANGQDEIQQFDGPQQGFASKQEAESWGIQFGRKWIDDGKPPLRKPPVKAKPQNNEWLIGLTSSG